MALTKLPNPSGLCFCGCGQRTSLAVQSHTRNGYVRGEPIRYVNGHNKAGKLAGVTHPRWNSGTLTHSGIHRWLRDHHQKTGVCETCGKRGRTHYASINGHVYTRSREDYAELCSPCHWKRDHAEGRHPSQAGIRNPRRRAHADSL